MAGALQVLVLMSYVLSRAPKVSVQRAEASAPAAWTCPPTAPCSPPTDLPAGAPSTGPLPCCRTTASRCPGQHPPPPPLHCSGFSITGSCATGCPPAPGPCQPLASLGTAACTHAPLLRTRGRRLRWRHARPQSHTLSSVAMAVPGEGGGPGRGGGRSAPGRTQPCPVARLGCGERGRPCAGSPRWLIAVLYFIK